MMTLALVDMDPTVYMNIQEEYVLSLIGNKLMAKEMAVLTDILRKNVMIGRMGRNVKKVNIVGFNTRRELLRSQLRLKNKIIF